MFLSCHVSMTIKLFVDLIFCFARIPWKDVVSMAADVARNGFNITHDLGNYRLLSCQTRGNCLYSCSFLQTEARHHVSLKQHKVKAHKL